MDEQTDKPTEPAPPPSASLDQVPWTRRRLVLKMKAPEETAWKEQKVLAYQGLRSKLHLLVAGPDATPGDIEALCRVRDEMLRHLAPGSMVMLLTHRMAYEFWEEQEPGPDMVASALRVIESFRPLALAVRDHLAKLPPEVVAAYEGIADMVADAEAGSRS
ncbi:MAG TPA: hypothetical protein VK252_06025 [Solirubrobacteraceae bacterium]|nr:hypothetical protein [Solirubrobacteraceae bacterium]